MAPNHLPTEPGALLGYRKDGRPFYLIAGGAPDPDEPDDKGDPDKKPDPDEPDDKGDPDEKLGDAGKRALAAERRARAAAEKAQKDLAAKVKEFEDRDKSEQQKAADKATEAETRATTAELKALRLEVAFDKGLTPAQAKRLTGSTKEELEADADELLELFGGDSKDGKDGDKKPPSHRPRERLRGGGDPDDEPEETDPAKLAASIPIRY